MTLNKTAPILSSALFALLAAATPAQSDTIPISYSLTGVGNVTGSTATTLTLQADSTGSFTSGNSALNAIWNPVSYTDTSVLNLNTNLLNGNFTIQFADGDTLVGDVFEDQTIPDNSPTGTGAFPQTLTFTGGTGQFAGASGSVTGQGFLGTTDFTVAGNGTLNLVDTPEPASHLLALGGLALMIAGAWFRRLDRNLERTSR